MRVVLDGHAGILANDWVLHLVTDDKVVRVKGIERKSEMLSPSRALALAELLATSSRPANKIAIFPAPKR